MPNTIEVIFSPALYTFRSTSGRHITVVIDILRFTTSLISVFENGASAVIPVSSLAEAERFQRTGLQVAAEREGLRLPFADYGNSAADFRTPEIKGKTLVYSTTNGTQAINLAAENGPVVAVAFANLPAVAEWLKKQNENLVILCSGWKNLLSIEDTICAGALTSLLLESENFVKTGDEPDLALLLWESCKKNLKDCLINTSHYKRLIALGVDPMADYTVKTGTSTVIPVFEDGQITDRK